MVSLKKTLSILREPLATKASIQFRHNDDSKILSVVFNFSLGYFNYLVVFKSRGKWQS